MMMRRGWFKESHRHYLAAKGIRTRRYAASMASISAFELFAKDTGEFDKRQAFDVFASSPEVFERSEYGPKTTVFMARKRYAATKQFIDDPKLRNLIVETQNLPEPSSDFKRQFGSSVLGDRLLVYKLVTVKGEPRASPMVAEIDVKREQEDFRSVWAEKVMKQKFKEAGYELVRDAGRMD